MITSKGKVKIIDFGCSKSLENTLGSTTSLSGTVFWMAPEFIKGYPCLNSDVWSLGCVIYEMVSFLF